MKKIKAAIVEDDKISLNLLVRILETQFDDIEIEWIASSFEDAQRNLSEKDIDLLFLDIELPPHTAFELFEGIPEPHFEVIFISAHEEYSYALRAIKMAALDYIVKPIKIKDILTAVDKMRAAKKDKIGELLGIVKSYMSEKPENFSKIVVHTNDGYDVVDIKNIIYIEALDSYTKIKLTGNKSYVASRSLKDFEELLVDKGFYRVHKSYLINFRHLMKIHKGLSPSVTMTEGTSVPISARKKEVFYTDLKSRIFF